MTPHVLLQSKDLIGFVRNKGEKERGFVYIIVSFG